MKASSQKRCCSRSGHREQTIFSCLNRALWKKTGRQSRIGDASFKSGEGSLTETKKTIKKTNKTITRLTKAKLISMALKNFGEKLEANEVKTSVGDFIRLLELQKEINEQQPREIKVMWVECEPVSAR